MSCNLYKRIRKLQKWAVRSITSSKYNALTDPIFSRLKLLKIQDVYTLCLLKFYYKYKNGLLPNFFNGMFDPVYAAHGYDTRNKEREILPRSNTQRAALSIRFSLPIEILKVSENVISKIMTHSLPGFSNYAKSHFISLYKTSCNIGNCYICKSSQWLTKSVVGIFLPFISKN